MNHFSGSIQTCRPLQHNFPMEDLSPLTRCRGPPRVRLLRVLLSQQGAASFLLGQQQSVSLIPQMHPLLGPNQPCRPLRRSLSMEGIPNLARPPNITLRMALTTQWITMLQPSRRQALTPRPLMYHLLLHPRRYQFQHRNIAATHVGERTPIPAVTTSIWGVRISLRSTNVQDVQRCTRPRSNLRSMGVAVMEPFERKRKSNGDCLIRRERLKGMVSLREVY